MEIDTSTVIQRLSLDNLMTGLEQTKWRMSVYKLSNTGKDPLVICYYFGGGGGVSIIHSQSMTFLPITKSNL